MPPGSYDRFTTNSNTSLTLGVASSTEPTVYNFTQLTVNNDSQIILAGPVILILKSGVTINNRAILGASPEASDYSFDVNVYSGDVNINRGAMVYVRISAPKSRVNINGTLCGWMGTKNLTVNHNGILRVKDSGDTGEQNEAPIADSQSLDINEEQSLAITLTASDPDGDALTYTIVTQPSHGTLSGTAPYLHSIGGIQQ